MLIRDIITDTLDGIKKANTLASYRDTLEPFGKIFGNRDAGEILPAEIREYLEALPVSDSTRFLRYAHIKALFNAALNALKQARIAATWENPCYAIAEHFSKPKKNSVPLADTIHADMQGVESRLRFKHRLIYALGTRGAMRISEILKITPLDLLRHGSTCCILLDAPKSGADREIAVIPTDLFDTLAAYVDNAGIGPDQRIFPMSRQAVWQVFRDKGIAPHDLRRYAAFRAMEMGKNLKTIQQMLRHSTISTTERYIKNMSVSALAEQLEGM